ncbi:MAG: hypothetical protein ACTJLK_00830 [Anaplasma sp.]
MRKASIALTVVLLAITVLCATLAAVYSIPAVVGILVPIATICGFGCAILVLRVLNLARHIRSLGQDFAVGESVPDPARDCHGEAGIARNSARYFNKLILIPIRETEIEEWFAEDRLKTLKELIHGRDGTLNLPCFVWSDQRQKSCLFVNGEVFFPDPCPVLPDSQHSPKTPRSLGVHPQFLQGVRVRKAVVPVMEQVSPYVPVEFSKGLLYHVTYEKLLDRSIVMETMLGLHMHNDKKLLKFSGDLLAGYIATQRQLLRKCSMRTALVTQIFCSVAV